jgi:hypothetical protein
MTRYRLKLLANEMEEEQEHLLEYLNDDAALNDAAYLAHAGQIEVWDGARLVGRFIGLAGAPD